MGSTHVATGLLAGTASAVPAFGLAAAVGADVQGWHVAAWIGAAAAWSLRPDRDHPKATATRVWGPVTYLDHVVTLLWARRHRWGTHDLAVGPWVDGLAVALLCLHPWGVGLVTAVALSLLAHAWPWVLPGRWERAWLASVVVCGAIGLAVAQAAPPAPWLGVAAALGVVVHILGDAVTRGGVPRAGASLGLVSGRWVAGRWPIRTGGAGESVYAVVTWLLMVPAAWTLAVAVA